MTQYDRYDERVYVRKDCQRCGRNFGRHMHAGSQVHAKFCGDCRRVLHETYRDDIARRYYYVK